MCDSLKVYLSPRIEKHCLKLLEDGHYKNAARESMIQVELALQDKGMVVDNRYGKNLINSLFESDGKFKNVKLCLPFGDKDQEDDRLQEKAKDYFGSVFSYYRNYLAHNSSYIDKKTALRVLIIASELLDLIDASSLSYRDIGGINGLLKAGLFDSEHQLLGLLETLNGYAIPGFDVGGMYENLFYMYGIQKEQIDVLYELDLLKYDEIDSYTFECGSQEYGWIELTELGKQFVNEIKKKILFE